MFDTLTLNKENVNYSSYNGEKRAIKVMRFLKNSAVYIYIVNGTRESSTIHNIFNKIKMFSLCFN